MTFIVTPGSSKPTSWPQLIFSALKAGKHVLIPLNGSSEERREAGDYWIMFAQAVGAEFKKNAAFVALSPNQSPNRTTPPKAKRRQSKKK